MELVHRIKGETEIERFHRDWRCQDLLRIREAVKERDLSSVLHCVTEIARRFDNDLGVSVETRLFNNQKLFMYKAWIVRRW